MNVADLWKFTPLHEAAAKGKFEICRLLLKVRGGRFEIHRKIITFSQKDINYFFFFFIFELYFTLLPLITLKSLLRLPGVRSSPK